MNDLNRNCTNMKILWKCCWKEWKWQLQAHLPSFQSQFNFNENVPPPNTQVSGHQSTQHHLDKLTWQTIIILTSQKNHHPDNLTKQQNLIFSWHQKQSLTCQSGASGSPNPDLCGKSLPSAQFSAKESAVHQSWGYNHQDVSFPLLLIIPFPFLWRRNFMRKEV